MLIQERKVIIVSTVRSSTDLLAYDARFALGFLSNARRFNGTPIPILEQPSLPTDD